MKIGLSSQLDAVAQRWIEGAVTDHFASRLFEKDARLWGKAAEAEATHRLGWVDNPSRWLPLVEELETFRAELAQQGVSSVIL